MGWRKISALGHDVWQAGGRTNPVLEMLRFFALTIVATAWLREMRVRHFTATAVVACGLLAAVLEVSQMLVASRMPGLVDVSINVAGVVAGGLLFRPLARAPSPRVWFVLLVAATWLAAMLPALNPYKPSMGYLPFWSMGPGHFNWAGVMGHLSEMGLMYFPLGLAIPWATMRTSRPYPRPYLWAVVVAVACELSLVGLQRWSGAVYPTAPNVVLAAFGALGGAWTGLAGQGWFQKVVAGLTAA